MTIEETVSAIGRTSLDAVVQGLVRLLVEWKLNADNMDELRTQRVGWADKPNAMQLC